MTEAEWLAATDPGPMLVFVRGKASDRKLRLLCLMCCEPLRHLLDDRGLLALDTAHRYAEDVATADQLRSAWEAANSAFYDFDDAFGQESAAHAVRELCSDRVAGYALEVVYESAAVLAFGGDWSSQQHKKQLIRTGYANLLRDIFGNPFRPVAFDPAWRTSTVVALAEGVYVDRAFDRLPILADALQEAGCDHPDILAHCRGDGPHARGCWVVDLVLGKS